MPQFILLPSKGLRTRDAASQSILDPLRAASTVGGSQLVQEIPVAQRPTLQILDKAPQDGPMLVEMATADAAEINAQSGPVRLTRVVTLDAPEPVSSPDPADLATGTGSTRAAPTQFTIECRETGTGHPLSNVQIYAAGGGATDKGVSDGKGQLRLTLAGNRLERLWAYTDPIHWGAYRTDISIRNGDLLPIDIDPVSVPARDAIAHYYRTSNFDALRGVTVGVIDTGVGPHSDLNLIGAKNAAGESPNEVDDWKGHGTHVAGLIGASPSPRAGVRGVAPGVSIQSYRVFRRYGKTTNYCIMKALILADIDGCDIINLSLGGGDPDESVEEAILDAREHGMLVVVAAGNNNRKQVTYPAAYPGVIAVSALGVVGWFPTGSSCDADVFRPPTSAVAPDEFIARFSNFGPPIAATAPGVGLISTLPNHRYGVYSGTSMAAPVVAGAAACLLSRNSVIFGMDRNINRSAALATLLQSNCTKRGFGLFYEGYGLPDPKLV